MYSYNYQYSSKGGSHPKVDYENITLLKATFLFGNEIPTNIRRDVKERLKILRKEKILGVTYPREHVPLNRFITSSLDYRESCADLLFSREFFRNREVIRIRPLLFRLGFKLVSEAIGRLPLEQMIDLDSLNQFVLTGKYINKEAYMAEKTSKEVQLQKQQA